MGGLFNPEAFVTATRQCVAQANSWSLEELSLDVTVADEQVKSFIDWLFVYPPPLFLKWDWWIPLHHLFHVSGSAVTEVLSFRRTNIVLLCIIDCSLYNTNILILLGTAKLWWLLVCCGRIEVVRSRLQIKSAVYFRRNPNQPSSDQTPLDSLEQWWPQREYDRIASVS